MIRNIYRSFFAPSGGAKVDIEAKEAKFRRKEGAGKSKLLSLRIRGDAKRSKRSQSTCELGQLERIRSVT